ncbi:MAG: AI-2E family transporter, partial [Bacteroidales bacterium]|nr:AI-2E family transporter [Bacteroidales bacterium]
ARQIIVPLVFATIIAIVLHPLVTFFVRIRVNRVVAIIITMLLTFIILAGFAIFMFSQASRFSESWPLLVDKFTELLNQSITWISQYFDIRTKNIRLWIDETKENLLNRGNAALGQTLLSAGNGLVIMLLIPVYIFMILYYHPLLIEFIRMLFGESKIDAVNHIIIQTKIVIQRYLIGLIIEAAIIAVLYTITLLILGIDYAIVLAIIGALLNMIPYIGGIVGVALPMIVALATKSSGWYAFYIMISYYFIQLVDNNYIVPKIVASKVKINALFSIIAVIIGNALWGIPGMFLAIPVLAILKLLLDNIESLKAWGFLLGDTMPPLLIIKPNLKKRSKKIKEE